MLDLGARPPQFKFNNLLNKHFSKLIFVVKSFLSRKNWQGEGGLLFEISAVDGY